MHIGRTIVGGVVGAAIGVVLHLALEVFGRIEAPWFAVIIGLLTGICVRKFDTSCAGHVSYVRGAIAGVIALCAIVGSTYLLSIAITSQAALAKGKPASVAPSQAAEDVASQNAEMEAMELAPEATVAPTRPAAGAGRAGRARDFSVMQFAFIAVGAFIAYELGRGTGRTLAAQHQPADTKTSAEQSDRLKDNSQ